MDAKRRGRHSVLSLPTQRDRQLPRGAHQPTNEPLRRGDAARRLRRLLPARRHRAAQRVQDVERADASDDHRPGAGRDLPLRPSSDDYGQGVAEVQARAVALQDGLGSDKVILLMGHIWNVLRGHFKLLKS